jgi:hypothetical protein
MQLDFCRPNESLTIACFEPEDGRILLASAAGLDFPHTKRRREQIAAALKDLREFEDETPSRRMRSPGSWESSTEQRSRVSSANLFPLPDKPIT